MTTEKMTLTDLEIVRAALDDDYEVIAELGRGGMATVFRARDRQLDREVAIKVLPFTLAFDTELVERFQREARLSAQLEHPNIVPIHRVGRSGQVIYFVMKLLRGEALSARIAKFGRLPAAEVRRVLSETASALGHAHRHGIVHRDVKPDNIMLDADGRCVVTDFGIARSGADTKLTAAGMSLGTPRYMSPEQARAGELDGRSDLYSLGVVGYECLVGRPPFDDGDAMSILMDHVQAPVPRPTLATMGTADERQLYATVERLLAKRPDQRFATADAFIAALSSPVAPALAHRARSATPTRAIAADLVGRAPESSAALDTALAAGLEMLRQQKPKVEAGLELLRQQRPKVEAGLAAGRRVVEENSPRVRAAAAQAAKDAGQGMAQVGALVAPRVGRMQAWVGLRSRRFWKLGAGGVAACWLAYAAGHYALMRRSHCPAVPVSSNADSASPAHSPAFMVLADPLGTVRHGSDLDVYYDVCGLSTGTVKTHLTVTKNESGLRRLLGDGVDPVSVRHVDAVTGPAMRRHESIDFGKMPDGGYTLDLVVKDEQGRVRQTDLTFRVAGQ